MAATNFPEPANQENQWHKTQIEILPEALLLEQKGKNH